jgi:alkanesulfonate monooxygenase SsuD/methylene tetrahydromethanopterin reductase-like flavin-dependent oxidoreductase (luciferase family)
MNGLQLGVFLSPRAAGIGRLRENVHAAEEAGFDFISVQDHPYVPDFLDTFALIGALIGQTSRIRFMTNVANLPLRPPQMLAKASASLDLLSGGRFELGLGAGRAWPQIAGLGGPVRTPAEALGATEEAIDVLRALPLLPTEGAERPRPGAPHRHLARRRRPADARPFRPQGRRLDGPPGHWL